MELAVNLTSIIISSIALLVAIASLCMTIGQKLSSHKIEWRPLQLADIEEEVEKEKEEQELSDAELVKEALKLNRKKKKSEDPLDEILETNNF